MDALEVDAAVWDACDDGIMTREALARVWGVVGVFLAVYAFNAWSSSQGGPALEGILGLDPRPTIACYHAIFVISVALVVLTCVGVLHAVRSEGGWAQRLPLIGFSPETTSTLDRSSRLVALYQGACLVALIVVPTLSLLRLNDEVLSAGVVWNKRIPRTAEQVKRPCDLLPWAVDDQVRVDFFTETAGRSPALRLANGEEDAAHAARCRLEGEGCAAPNRSARVTPACEENVRQCDGVEWFAYLSPALMFLLSGAGWIGSGTLLFFLFRSAPKPTPPSAAGP
jgi:hypothetical protein